MSDGFHKSHQRWPLLAVGAITAAALLYARTLKYGAHETWDDGKFVLYRPELLDWWSSTWTERLLTPEIGYPIPLPTFVQAHIRFLAPDAYLTVLHGLSVALHLTCAILIFRLLHHWNSQRTAALTTSLWVVHPAMVETVAWLTNLKTLLATLFSLVALHAWTMITDAEHTRRHWVILFGALVLALASRPDAAVIPLAMVLVTIWRAPENRRLIAVSSVTAALTALYAITVNAMHTGVVARSIHARFDTSEYLLRIFRALELAVANTLVPINLAPAYFYRADSTALDALPGMALMILLVLVAALLWQKKRHDVVLALSLSAVFYLPFSNVLFLPRLSADTYLYLPSVFFLFAIVTVLSPALDRSRALTGALLAALVVASFISNQQISRWENPETLWTKVAMDQPGADRPFRHLIWYHYEREEYDEADAWLNKGLPAFRSQRAIPWYSIPIREESSGANEAADLAIEAMMRNHVRSPELEKAYLELLVTHSLALPENESVRQLTASAAESYAKTDAWIQRENVATTFAFYFLKNQLPALAARFVEVGFRHDPKDCQLAVVWRMLDSDVQPPLDSQTKSVCSAEFTP